MRPNDWRAALYIAYKSILRGNRSTVALMIFILSLSFINMMFISGLMNGFGAMIPQMFIDDMSAHIYVTPQEDPSIRRFIIDQTTLRSQIETIPGVIATTRRYDLAGSVAYDKDRSGEYKSVSAGIAGIDPDQDARVMAIHDLMRYGQWLSDADTDQIILSSALAGGYGDPAAVDLGGVKVGDKVRVTYDDGLVRTYTVKGIWHDNMDSLTSFVSSREAESALGVYDSASKILVKVDLKRHPLGHYVQDIQGMAPSLKVHTYTEVMGSYKSITKAIHLIGVIVSVISVAVAAVTIFILIYVNALNKRRQIGILKAIGVKQGIIVASYVFQALFYVVASVAIGSLLVFGVLHPYFAKYPIEADIGTISLLYSASGIAAGVASFLIAAALSGWLPSRIVARQDIVKSIWF